ncbi:hypothetical protein [Streptomyces beigongshangae]|uniref:hypothetical protein n=1 Tax=Streptomyces beigongshangae TaxID=2841597 RepID=UPI001C854C1C|nr:hypothetical protein [Streptomyces sp. REN17]
MTHRTRLTVAGALATALLSATPAVAATPGAGMPYTWTVEKGHALACTGEREGVRVSIDLYENSAFGTHAQVFVETAETEYVHGGETAGGLFDDGRIRRRLLVAPQEQTEQEQTAKSSRTVLVSGSYTTSGPRRWVHEVYDEPSGQVVSKGWNTPLAATVTVNALGRRVALTCETAFAYDLRVGRPADSGN